jgi:hypothetical protein
MSLIPTSNIPVSVNYTGRDYYVLRDQLVLRIKDRLPNWVGTDPSDFGVALVEALAYMGDLLSYYIDRNANETALLTATQRTSLLNIAQNYGYVPAGSRQSYLDITFSNSSNADVTLPMGTIVYGQVATSDVVQDVYFTTMADVIVPTLGSETVGSTEGRPVTQISVSADPTYGELIGTSGGDPGMTFILENNPIVDGSIDVYVQDGDVYSKWTQVQHLVDYGPLDLVYTTSVDQNQNVYINFGDGVSGAIPVIYSAIRATYIVGGGTSGNVQVGTVQGIVYVPGLSESQVTALQATIIPSNNAVAYGGADPESNDQIRFGAASTLRSSNRAVTLKDYADLARTVSGVGKARSVASTWTSVTVYIAPTRNDGDTDLQPGLDASNSPTLEYTTLAANVSDFFTDKIMIGTTVTVQPPSYTDVIATIAYTKQPQYTVAETEKAIKLKLITTFSYNNIDFAETITPQTIEYSINQLPQIQNAHLTTLARLAGSGLNTLVAADNEIFRFQESNLNIGPA